MKSLSEITSVLSQKIEDGIMDLIRKVLNQYLEREITPEECKEVKIRANFSMVSKTTYEIIYNSVTLGEIILKFPQYCDAMPDTTISLFFIPNKDL